MLSFFISAMEYAAAVGMRVLPLSDGNNLYDTLVRKSNKAKKGV